MTDQALLDTIDDYTRATVDALNIADRLVLFLRGLRSPEIRAQRLRRQAARLWRTADRAQREFGYTSRALNLRARAADKWKEAQRLYPLALQAAVLVDSAAA